MMRKSSRHTLLALCGAICLTVALACSDSTGPDPISRSLAGTYDLSTDLDSLTYTDSCAASAPAGSPLYCHDTTVVNTVGTLDGVVIMGDTIRGINPEFTLPITNAALRLGACGTSCSPDVTPFSVSPASVVRTGRDSLEFTATMTGPAWLDFEGWIADDSISGHITVVTQVNCCMHRYYTGTFVLKRRPPEY
jgi:hypothetical protein